MSRPVIYCVDWSNFNGGAQVSMTLLIEEIIRTGADVYVVAPPGAVLDRLAAAGATPVPTGIKDWEARPRDVGATMTALARLLSGCGPAVVHVSSPLPAVEFALLGPLAKRSKMIYHYRAIGGASKRGEWLIRQALRAADLVLVPTPAGIADSRRIARDMSLHVECIPNPIPGLGEPPDPARTPTAPFKLLMIARNEPVKGPDIALDLLAEINADEYRAHLTLVCDLNDSQNPRFARQVSDRLISLAEHVTVMAPPVDVPRVIRESDLVIMPSRNEGFGRVAGEALAVGRPVIAHNVGGLPHVLDREAALVEVGDIAGFAEKTLAALTEPAIRNHLVSRRDELSQYESSAVAQRVLATYFTLDS
jgi:glycosyltransferase involved in cell wall biosynthesis